MAGKRPSHYCSLGDVLCHASPRAGALGCQNRKTRWTGLADVHAPLTFDKSSTLIANNKRRPKVRAGHSQRVSRDFLLNGN